MTKKMIIRDRNNSAYLLANGFTCDFVPRPDGGLDCEFIWNIDLDTALQDYMSNRGVPVQSFVTACRYIADRIREHRQRVTI